MAKIKRSPLDFIRPEATPKVKGNVREGYRKVTFQLKESLFYNLQRLPFDIRENSGEKPTQIDLINEAVEMLLKKYEKKIAR